MIERRFDRARKGAGARCPGPRITADSARTDGWDVADLVCTEVWTLLACWMPALVWLPEKVGSLLMPSAATLAPESSFLRFRRARPGRSRHDLRADRLSLSALSTGLA